MSFCLLVGLCVILLTLPCLTIYFSVTPFIRTLFIVLYIFPVVYLGLSQKPVMKIIAKAFND